MQTDKTYSNYGSTNFNDTRINFGIVEANEIEEKKTSLPLIILSLGDELKKIRSTLGFRTYAFISEYPKATLGMTVVAGTTVGLTIFPLTPFFDSSLSMIANQNFFGMGISALSGSLASVWGWGITRQITSCTHGSKENNLSIELEIYTQDQAYDQFIKILKEYYGNPCEKKIPELFKQFSLIHFNRWVLPRNPVMMEMNQEDIEGALKCFLLRDVHLVLTSDFEDFETPILNETPTKLLRKILNDENEFKDKQLFDFFVNEKNIQDLFGFLKCEIPSKKGIDYFVENYSVMLPFLPFGC